MISSKKRKKKRAVTSNIPTATHAVYPFFTRANVLQEANNGRRAQIARSDTLRLAVKFDREICLRRSARYRINHTIG